MNKDVRIPAPREHRTGAFNALTLVVVLTSLGLLSLQLEQLEQMGGANLGDRAFVLPWPVLSLAYATATGLRLRFAGRDQSETIALFELPVLVALFFSDHNGLVLGAMTGTLIGLLARGIRDGATTVFGIFQVVLAAELGLATFHPLSGAVHTATTRPLLAAATAVVVARLVYAALSVLAASARGQRPGPRVLRRAATVALLQAVTTGSIGLIAIVVLFHVPQFAWLLAVPFIASYVAARAYTTDLRRLDELEFLQQSSRILSHSPQLADAMDGLLEEVRNAFAARHAEVVLLDSVNDRSKPSRRAVHRDDAHKVTLDTWDALDADLLLLDKIGDHESLRASILTGDQWLAGTRHRTVMACRLISDGDVYGALIVADPVNGEPFTAAQTTLLEGLADTTTTTLRSAASQHASLEAEDLRQRLHVQSSTDSLTGLPNRLAFVEAVDHAIGEGIPIGLLHIDLDDFRSVNDSLGQAAGDRLLREIGQRLQFAIRPGDLAARLASDEFGVLLRGVAHDDDVSVITARVQEDLTARLRIDEHPIDPSASIGSAILVVGEGATDVLGRAILAAQWAKRDRRGSWQPYRPEMAEVATKQLALRTDLVRALDDEQLDVHFQPFHAIDDARVVGCEALVRWTHPERGFVSPDQFIPLAEETGLITRVGELVMRRSLEALAIWQHEHDARIVVSINVSATELESPDLVTMLGALLQRTAVDPSLVMLEITERDLMRNTGRALERLNALKALGVQLAIDDFGTGYSSLAYLQQFPIDVIKIAKEFVDRVDDPTDGGVVAGAMIDLTHALGMRTLAEAIETSTQHARLRELGCEIGQGWLWSKAEPAAKFSARLISDGWGADSVTMFTSAKTGPRAAIS